MKFCFLDLETTGLEAEKDSILEISFLVCDEKGKILDSFDEVIIPEKSPLTPYVTNITGISEKEIATKGKPLDTIRLTVNKKIKDTVIVGHNIDFDIVFLRENNFQVPDQRIDTHELARITLVNEESYSLEILSQKYGFIHTDAHRAMSDVEASRDLFFFLQKKIPTLPSQFFQNIVSVLRKTDWYARYLFENVPGEKVIPSFPETKYVPRDSSLPAELQKKLQNLSAQTPLFIKEGDSLVSGEYIKTIAENLRKKEKILIVSPKLSFFEGIKKFPIPEILFNPERAETFVKKREKLSDSETAFILKCILRDILGFRGVDHFNLFAGERRLWKEVHIENPEHPLFQKIITEKDSEEILLASPQAFLRFIDTPCFEERTLLIDESEVFAEKLLFAPTEEFSFFSYLNSPEENISIAAQFFVTQVCREIIEPRIQRALGPFPEKILLEERDIFSSFEQSLEKFVSSEESPLPKKFLTSPPEKSIRWIYYSPFSGNLSLNLWEPQKWREKQKELKKFKKIFFHRHTVSESNAFFRIFIGQEEGIFHEEKDLLLQKTLVFPENPVSANSPDFVPFCADHILEYAQKYVDEKNNLLVNFSSQETLGKIHTSLFDRLAESNITLLGEGVSGGIGKLLQKLKPTEKLVLFTQNLIDPSLAQKNFSHLIVQKFPFSPPHPLLEVIQNLMRESGQSLWETWTMPQLEASISRRISVFPEARKILWLDPRYNSDWGKKVLQSVFSVKL
ncbi:3'-5' exonuclease [Candidatus Gracilibacteria bacterium]|nr:3'-5' exonuclease [Candidatus Gracilibacteria bacterium]MCF7819149.1 3'-5' exonuclease [Candidatus Gracilibacteria bacterium]